MSFFSTAFDWLSGLFGFITSDTTGNPLMTLARVFATISAVLVLLYLIPWTRSVAAKMLHGKYRFLFLWSWRIVLSVWQAHFTILNHLITSKKEIFRGLRKDLDKEEDLARDR